jgi:4-amino-4-deoxy-L-arabinose transferase-like glycosyltransferase
MNDKRGRTLTLILLGAILLFGWGLATLRLGERSFWGDEGHTALLAIRTTADTLLETLGQVNSPLHMFVLLVSVQIGRSEWLLRLPSAMAAVLALPVVYLLGRRFFGRTAGLVGAFLLAISPFALGYAQEARIYAIFELLSCLSLLLWSLAMARRRWYWWAGFTLVTAATLYSHFFAWFILGAEVLLSLCLLARQSWIEQRLDGRLPGLMISLLVVLILYLPWVPPLLGFWERQGPGGQTLPAGLEPFQASLDFFRHMVAVFGARTYGWQFWLFATSFVLGLASLAMGKKWLSLALVALLLGFPPVLLSLVPSQHFFDYRYLIFALPWFLLVTGEGISLVASLPSRLGWLVRYRHLQPLLALGLALLLFVPANLPALADYTRWEKENWRGIGQFVVENLQSDEAIVVSPRYWADTLVYYQPSLEAFLAGGLQVAELEGIAGRYGGLWFVRHAAPLGDPSGELSAWVRQQGGELLIDAQACGAGIHVFYLRFGVDTEAASSVLLDKAASFCPSDPRFQTRE